MATDPLIYPIGHYTGAFYHRPGAPDRYHTVLVGLETARLSDEQFAVWLLARGATDGDRPWNRAAVEELAQQAGIENVAAVLDELGERGLVLETIPGTKQAIDFAESHRVVPLLLGLGNTPEQPGLHGIGLFDQPILAVSHEVYGMWEWADVDSNLWAACFSHADVAKRAGATEPAETEPEQVLTGFLASLQTLLVANAVFLDVDLGLAEPGGDGAAEQPAAARPGAADDALVFPIGHYVGAFHPEVNAPLAYQRLRVGVEIERLVDEHEFGMWALAHGFPDRLAEMAWTRHALLDAAELAGIPDPATALDRMVARGLVAQVHPDLPEAVEFARRHRIRPLLNGLGNSPEDLRTFGIGLIGLPPVVTVDRFGYEVWLWGRTAPNLWLASEIFTTAGESDRRQSVARILRLLHRLLAGNAGYLDVATPG